MDEQPRKPVNDPSDAKEDLLMATSATPAPDAYHPLAGTANAWQLRSVLTGACCEYGDGSGKFDADAARELLAGFRGAMATDALAASDLEALTWLGRALKYFIRGLAPVPCPGLAELRAALSQALQDKLPAASDPNYLAYAINVECFEYADGSGALDRAAARRLFEGRTAEQFATPFAAANRSSLGYLSGSLDRLAAALGAEPCDGLEQLRRAVAQALAQTLAVSRQQLAAARDAEALVEAIARTCCLSNLSFQSIDGPAARSLFAGLDVNRVRQTLAASSGPSLSKLARLLAPVSQALAPPCEEVELLRHATAHALRRWLEIVREELGRPGDADVLMDVLAAACCEYSDGSGEVTEPAVRLLFDGLPAEPLVGSAVAAGLKTVLKLRTVLGRIGQGLKRTLGPPCAGLEEMLAATVPAVRLTLGEARNADDLRAAVAAVCCEYSDGSGRLYAEQTRCLFEGLSGDAFQAILAGSDRPARQQLARLLQRLALTVGYPRCAGLEALRQALPE